MIAVMSYELAEQLMMRTQRHRVLEKGSFLFQEGDKVRSVFVVGEGRVELTRCQSDGASIILQRATGRDILAEASLYSTHYHCDGLVARRSTVFEISKRDFLALLRDDSTFSNLWAAHLAREVQAARYLCEILARKTVSERLDGWLAWHGTGLPEKGQWKAIAGQIGVSPEALYRELARRRRVKE